MTPTSRVRRLPCGLVVEHHGPPSPQRRPAIPEVRAVDDGELQSLGPVDGQNLHRVGVGIEAPAAVLGVGGLDAGLLDPAG